MGSIHYRIKTVLGHEYLYKVEETSLGRIEKVSPSILAEFEKQKQRGKNKRNKQ